MMRGGPVASSDWLACKFAMNSASQRRGVGYHTSVYFLATVDRAAFAMAPYFFECLRSEP